MRHGFLLINKPRGPTSHDVVARLRSSLGESSIGHLGTLDPLADGLLVLAVGKRALKVVELFAGLTKEYLAELTLGAESTTYDAEGMITSTPPKPGWVMPGDVSSIQALIADRFIGKIKQTPPAFSAVHVGGERAYKKAMRGEHVELKARETSITACAVEEFTYPLLTLRVACGSGTYIRSLAHDLGQSMRCGAFLSALTRTRVGEWRVEDAHMPDQAAWADVLPLKDILRQFPGREISPDDWEHLQHGRSIDGVLPDSGPYFAWFKDLPVALLDRDPRAETRLKPRKVL